DDVDQVLPLQEEGAERRGDDRQDRERHEGGVALLVHAPEERQGRVHEFVPVGKPVAIYMISRSSSARPSSLPAMRPSRMTSTRSHMPMISSSSLEMSMTAAPFSASSARKR